MIPGSMEATSESLGDAGATVSRSTGTGGRRKHAARIFPRVAYPKGNIIQSFEPHIDQCWSNFELQ